MSTPQAPTRRRQKRPKVKTGCATCKIRRVKCDETKPECLRCQRFGPGYCDGYDKPEGDQSIRRAMLARRLSLVPAPNRTPVTQNFRNQDESSCFRLYCEEVAPHLSSSDKSIWHQLLLQAGQDQPYIRHAIITIGSSQRSLNILRMRFQATTANGHELEIRPALTKIDAFTHEQYGKFLQGAKENIASLGKEQGSRMAMMACLLVICVENMQYRYDIGLAHANNGFHVMEDLMRNTDPKDNDGISSPIPNLIEDELIQQFRRMQLQIMAVYEGRTDGKHYLLKLEGSSTVENMPNNFTTVDQARLYLELIMRRTFHFITDTIGDNKSVLKFRENDHELGAHPAPEFLLDVPGSLQNISDDLEIQHGKYVADIRRWAQSFDTIYRTAIRNVNKLSSIPALLLQIHSLTMRIRLGGRLANTEMVYDKFMFEFEKIVELSRIVLNSPHTDVFFPEGGYNFDMGLIYALMTPSMKCRDRRLRREAIQLLELRPWREVQWGSESAADISRYLMEIEEEGIETAHIPESARARVIRIESDLATRTGRIACIQGVGESAIIKETVRHWANIVG